MSLEKFVVVNTQYGPVKGDRRSTLLGVDYINFQCIPYMRAPLGKLRFRSPVEPEVWTEPLDATKSCPQYPIFEAMFTNSVIGVEDAGFVNIFTKDVKPKSLLPVLVYIHGGGFQGGSSSPDSMHVPTYLLQKEVVYVSINYRTGAMGFLSLESPSLKVPGNAGLKDQRMALKWIKQNIANFGGDPENITLFGTSAGGASVHYHLISNGSRDLFHRAIAMSGTSLNTSWALHPRRNYAERIARLCGYEGSENEANVLEFLENADINVVVEASEKVLTDTERYVEHACFAMGPVVEPYVTEDTFVDKSPILMARNAWSKDIDVIFGGTSNEGILMRFLNEKHNKRIENMKNFANFVPILDLNFSFVDPKLEKYGKRIKEAYYGALEPSADHYIPFLYFQADHQFWHGIQRSVLSRINAKGKGKTFTYRFDILTELNTFRKLFNAENDPGVEHGACLGYLFSGILFPSPKIDSVEFKNILKIVNIVTNFAIYGRSGIDEWQPNESLELPLKCLNLTKDTVELIDLPETTRLKVFDDIYTELGAILY